jgi:succinylarginine dihydrolase
MWTANAATVSPSPDTADGRVHFTPANLISQFHRAIEPATTTRILRTIFADDSAFVVHDPLPAAVHFADEGAANHMRLAGKHGESGLEIFVYGRRGFGPSSPQPKKFPARQTLEASQAIARNHQLDPARVTFLQQNPAAIDAGAFHNDVVAVANEGLMVYQKDAFADPDPWTSIIQSCPHESGLYLTSDTITLADAVRSYFFNSQLITLPDGSMSLIAPVECKQVPAVADFLDSIVDNKPISVVHYVDVRQSMHNGGGPACLRLRVVLSDEQIAKMHGNVILTPALHDQLRAWIEKHYRDELNADDLRDPHLITESRDALDELSQLLQLGPIYEFQRSG